MRVVEDLPNDGSLVNPSDLIVAINQRFDAINADFNGLSSSGKSTIQDPAAYGGQNSAVEGNAFTYSNPDVNVYDFLDPLFLALRQNQVLVNQAQMLNNSIGPLALQVDSVTARVIQAGAVTANKINVNQLSAISANMGTITAGNITLDSSGFIRGGATTYNSGVGFWLGYSGGAYKFFVGNSSGQKLLWDGTNLNITGSISATTGTIGGWTIGSTTISSGGVTLDSSGNVRAGQGSYNTGTGFWLGVDGSTPQLSIGNPAGNSLTWNGTTLAITGSLSATTGTIGGWTIGSTTITGGSVTLDSAGNVRAGQSGYNTGSGFWLGVDSGTPKFSIGNPAGSYLTWDGSNLAYSGQGSSTLSFGSGSSTTKITTTGFTYGDTGSSYVQCSFGSYAIIGAYYGSNSVTMYGTGAFGGQAIFQAIDASSNSCIIEGNGLVMSSNGSIQAGSGGSIGGGTLSLTGAATIGGLLTAPATILANQINSSGASGWTCPLFDGGNNIFFQWMGSSLNVMVGATLIGAVTFH